MNLFSFDPQIIFKMKEGKLLLISADPDKNVLFEFEGPVAKILEGLMQAERSFSEDQITIAAQSTGASKEEVQTFLEFCLTNGIIIKA